MNSRKGYLTIPNIMAVVLILFVFSVFYSTAIKPALIESYKSANLLTKAVLVAFPFTFLLMLSGLPFSLAELDFIQNRGKKQEKQVTT